MASPADYPTIALNAIKSVSYSKYLIIRSLNASYPVDYLIHGPDAAGLTFAYSNIQTNCASYGPFSIIQQAFPCAPCPYPDYCSCCGCPWQIISEDCCDICQTWLSRPLRAVASPNYEKCLLTQLRQQSIYTAGDASASLGEGIKTIMESSSNVNWGTVATVGLLGVAVSAGVIGYVIRRRQRRESDMNEV